MQVTYSIKGADLFAAQKYANKQQGVRGKYSLWVYLIACFVAPLLIFTLWPAHNVVRGTPLAFFRAVVLPILLTLLMLLTFLRVFRSQKSREWETVGSLTRPRNVDLHPDYILATEENSKTVMSWQAIHNIIEGKDHVFFFLNTKDAIILPKRCFASPQEMQQFYQTALTFWEKARDVKIKAPLPDPRQS